jgi:hypothetical protein
VNLGHLLLNNHREAEARSPVEKVLKAARTAAQPKMAQGLLEQMRNLQAGQEQSNP